MWNDPSTWRRNAPELARIARHFEWITGDLGPTLRRPDYSAWLQDDWTLSQRFTLNLGVRYDVSINKYANDVEVQPFLPAVGALWRPERPAGCVDRSRCRRLRPESDTAR